MLAGHSPFRPYRAHDHVPVPGVHWRHAVTERHVCKIDNVGRGLYLGSRRATRPEQTKGTRGVVQRPGAMAGRRSADVNTVDQTPDRAPRQVDAVPDRADDLRDLGEWLTRLAPALGRMPQVQRRALLRATDALRADLASINLGVRA